MVRTKEVEAAHDAYQHLGGVLHVRGSGSAQKQHKRFASVTPARRTRHQLQQQKGLSTVAVDVQAVVLIVVVVVQHCCAFQVQQKLYHVAHAESSC